MGFMGSLRFEAFIIGVLLLKRMAFARKFSSNQFSVS